MSDDNMSDDNTGTKATDGPPPKPDDIDGRRAMAHAVQELRNDVLGLKGLAERVDQLFGLHAATDAKIAELKVSDGEIVAAIDHHADTLTGVNAFLEELARAPAMRRGDAPARTLPAPIALPGMELPSEIEIDPTKVGTQITELPGGGVVEVNVRRPGGAMIRDGKPTVNAPGKVRR